MDIIDVLINGTRATKPTKIEPRVNKFLVSANCTGGMIAILRPPPPMLPRSDALLLASLLVDASCRTDQRDFESMLRYVRAHA